ncbi:MAG: hemolysin family protein [Victivallaceae bacterium]|nr:hemolysin family protein [Victivallaceae bacterium]
MSIDFLILGILVFIWLLTAWEFFNGLTPGRIRRLETENKNTVKKLDFWSEHRNELNVIFRYLLLLLLSVLSIMLFSFVKQHNAALSFYEITGWVLLVVFALLLICSLVSRLMLKRMDIFFLRMTLPLLRFLTLIVFRPVLFLIKITESGAAAENDEEKTSAEDEIMSLVEHASNDHGESLEEDEKRMIRGIFDLDNTLVREIMTPRVDMSTLSVKASLEEAKHMIVQSGHSRIPVYGKNIDEIRGIIYAKDFLDTEKPFTTLADFMHAPLFIPETKNVGDLLEEFQTNKIHVAIIIDEYGGTAGVVTLEDIIEEIVGEIHDEYDQNEDENNETRLMPDGTIHAEGRCLVCDINHEFGLELPEDEDVDTIAGYVCGEFGKIPKENEEITIDGIGAFKILKADRRRVILIEIKPFNPNHEKVKE